MCLIGLALDAHPRYALVVAANRDEYFDRPALPLDWWTPAPGATPLLSGRDLSAGGTWLGVSQRGRVAMLTNVRDPARQRPQAPSRGTLVTDWLHGAAPAASMWPHWAARGCNPFNLIGGDLGIGQWWWADDRSESPVPLGPGVYGLSNAALDTPWPKVRRLKQRMRDALAPDTHGETLRDALWGALADRDGADDAEFPDTGVGLARERWLAPAFIHAPERHYGTRCSTVLLGMRTGTGWQLEVSERSFDPAGALSGERHVAWHWSPGTRDGL